MKSAYAISVLGAAVVSALFNIAAVQAAEVNIYSARQEELIKPLLDKFSSETGIKVNLITGKPDELIRTSGSGLAFCLFCLVRYSLAMLNTRRSQYHGQTFTA